METVFDALKALKRASSHVVASRLGISREDAVNELWKLKRRGEADNKGSMWWLIQAGESEPVSPVPKVTAQMLTEAIEQHGPQTADELALMFGITSRRANSSLAMANRELRRAKSHVQKWERVCAALRELNKHRDIVRQIVDSSGRIVSEK
ncbi:DUF1627 domain-containing protein [Shigella sonnei]